MIGAINKGSLLKFHTPCLSSDVQKVKRGLEIKMGGGKLQILEEILYNAQISNEMGVNKLNMCLNKFFLNKICNKGAVNIYAIVVFFNFYYPTNVYKCK